MVSVFFATNRNNLGTEKHPRFGDRFHKDGPGFYRVGVAEVSKVSDDPDTGYHVNSLRLNAESRTGPPRKLGSAELFSDLQGNLLSERRDILVYIHGFANDLASCLSRAAQLSDAYQITRPDGSSYSPAVFAFSWPSNGQITPPWHYFSDRDDAEASGKAMARSLLRLLDFLKESRRKGTVCHQRLHLVVHSMGNWALRHALQGLRNLVGDDHIQPVFENIFLMAADEDEDALEPQNGHKLGLLPKLGRGIHVYHSADDGALVISDTTKFNPDRLGSRGPKTFSGLSTRITAIDCELVDRTVLAHLNHQYYRLRPEVIEDVRAVLSGLERPETFPWRETVEAGRRYRIRLNGPET